MKHWNGRACHIVFLGCVLQTCSLAMAVAAVDNGRPERSYTERAEFRRVARQVTLTARSHRPLLQAVNSVAEEYGWVVNLEEPALYSSHDLVDHTPANWIALHPNANRLWRARGGSFASNYTETRYIGVSGEEKRIVLERIVADYNASGNPGRYALRSDAKGIYSIVGEGGRDGQGAPTRLPPVLDRDVFVPRVSADAYAGVCLIVEALNESAGKKVILGSLPVNWLVQRQVSFGGTNRPARELLQELIAQAGLNLSWRLLFDPRDMNYTLNLTLQRRVRYSEDGTRHIVPKAPETH